MGRRKIINPGGGREGQFFKKKDFDFEVTVGREYLNSDAPATIFLYKVDYTKTVVDDLYGETYANEKVTHEPIELQVKISIEEKATEYVAEIGMPKQYSGNLIFTIYSLELEEKQTDINKGDYIGHIDYNGKMRFYEVWEDDKVNVSNSKTIGGIKSFYRKIEASPIDKDVFNG